MGSMAIHLDGFTLKPDMLWKVSRVVRRFVKEITVSDRKKRAYKQLKFLLIYDITSDVWVRGDRAG